jgi:hypothetical protein
VICSSVSRSTPLREAPQDRQRAESWPEGSSSCTSQKGQRREWAPVAFRSCISLNLPFRCCSLGEVCGVHEGKHIGQVANLLYAMWRILGYRIFTSLPERMEAPHGGLLPRRVGGRLWRKAGRGAIVVV